MRKASPPLGDTLIWPSADSGAVATKKIRCCAIQAPSSGLMFSCRFMARLSLDNLPTPNTQTLFTKMEPKPLCKYNGLVLPPVFVIANVDHVNEALPCAVGVGCRY